MITKFKIFENNQQHEYILVVSIKKDEFFIESIRYDIPLTEDEFNEENYDYLVTNGWSNDMYAFLEQKAIDYLVKELEITWKITNIKNDEEKPHYKILIKSNLPNKYRTQYTNSKDNIYNTVFSIGFNMEFDIKENKNHPKIKKKYTIRDFNL